MPERFVSKWGKKGRWPHFTPSEVGVPCAVLLLDALERARVRGGDRPLPIISGRRTKAHNAAVGGAPESQHLFGRAVDIPSGYLTVEEAIMVGFSGIGDRDGWAVHVDVRPGPLARWTYVS
jgi:uncharacterized protein YcbK (DUF882 family)